MRGRYCRQWHRINTPSGRSTIAMDLYASAQVQNFGARLRASLVCKHMMYMSPERHGERKILEFQALQLHTTHEFFFMFVSVHQLQPRVSLPLNYQPHTSIFFGCFLHQGFCELPQSYVLFFSSPFLYEYLTVF